MWTWGHFHGIHLIIGLNGFNGFIVLKESTIIGWLFYCRV